MLDVYAYLTDDNVSLYAVYKPYFVKHAALDDGSSDLEYPDVKPYSKIESRLEKICFAESSTTRSLFEYHDKIRPLTPATIKAMMVKHNINMIFDCEAYNTYIRRMAQK